MQVRGRFAPSPSGRMHLGNLMSALLAWLDVRSQGGVMVLRVEDLDPDRCTVQRAEQVVDDLLWLGLDWDEGGLTPDYMQSKRAHIYAEAFQTLSARGLTYPCYCTRAERLAVSAPHRADGTVVYNGRCAHLTDGERGALEGEGRSPAWRIRVPDEDVVIEDGHMGQYRENLRRHCGDFILRRSDGVWAYQLAVVADDALMGINHVVRGSDLLSSSPRQAWLHGLLGYRPPIFYHLPLLVDHSGRRLSKRDGDLDMSALRRRFSPTELTGWLAWQAGLLEGPKNVTPKNLVPAFSWAKVPKKDIVVKLP